MKSVFAGVCVTDEEANYSYYVIWLLLDTIIVTVDKLKFHCGEIYQHLRGTLNTSKNHQLLQRTIKTSRERSTPRENDQHLHRTITTFKNPHNSKTTFINPPRSVGKEFSRRNIHSNEHYKSVGCILTLIDGVYMELLLLEVSGSFKLDDESRFVEDHVKAGYGLVAMLNEIAYTYNFASFDVFTTVRIFFLHAKKNKFRFWSFEMPSPGVNVPNLLNSVVIPDNCASCELPVESLCIELWNLRTML